VSIFTRPQPHTFTANPVGELVASNTGGVVDLKLSVPATPATDILVLGAAPGSAGVSFVSHYVILGRLPAPEGGCSSIRKLHVDRYGEPAAGARSFIRTRQVHEGCGDFPLQTTAMGASHLLRIRQPALIDPSFSGVGDVLAFRPVCQNGTPEQGLSPTVSPPYPHAA
jgi:hypothetical protein